MRVCDIIQQIQFPSLSASSSSEPAYKVGGLEESLTKAAISLELPARSAQKASKPARQTRG